MKNFITLVLCVWLSTSFAEEIPMSSDPESTKSNFNYRYTATFDKNMSSISSANFAMSGIEAYRQFDDFYFENAGIYNRALSYFTRFMATTHIIIANHEIGGHGARAREFGLGTSYKVSFFNGTTKLHDNSSKFSDFPLQKRIAIDAAGIQASHLLAENIKTRCFESNNINPTYGVGYFVSQGDQPIYILFSKKDRKKDDISSYIKNINTLYNTNYLTKSKLKHYAVLDFLDPFMWYSGYSYVMNQEISIPMFKINQNIEYLPAIRSILATYGLERKLVNHFKFNDQKYAQLSMSYGKNMNFKSYAIGANAYNIVNIHNVALGAELMFWSQPQILIAHPTLAKSKLGGLFAVNTNFDLYKTAKGIINGVVSVGIKSKGFVEGRPLQSSWLLRAGLQLNL